MTYTMLAVVSVVAGLAVDRWLLRTRLTSTATWWLAYAIIVFFQLLTNGWLTGREIVRYRADAIIGDSQPQLIGDGRLFYAPVEDLGFGFGLVLIACAVWVRLGRGGAAAEAS
ncbi:lycopene cyclase domain-containing protein [Nocardioides flavescens]|uniref:Lycopene cyclase domain-containing protein n=1 Tax=Nocardioides flavescens TaxID=2691959 RepID=A0A6L7F2T7_9ACTN|nr:lycopene cyclase domain-containing protein [Nocardioides flavescens]MXG91592.1 lycopene cyclase domain-containing protein [Nocardioides flavescens]